MDKINRILFFEDDEQRRNKLAEAIKSDYPDIDLILVDKELVNILVNKDIAIEDAVAKSIKEKFDTKQIDLIVADHDLSKLDSKLSESVITAAAHQLAIPVCRYHRRIASAASVTNWDLNSKVFAIDVDTKINFPENIIDMLKGFKKVQEKYSKIGNEIRKKGPASVLAHILEAPGQVTHLSLYTSGVSFFNDPFIVRNMPKDSLQEELERRIPYVLSYWLLNVILRFPGIILNETAAASYLDIDIIDFRNEQLSQYFEEAKYTGPFSGSQNYWWRAKLDDLLDENDIDSYLDYLDYRGYKEKFNPSMCSIDNKLPAGFYDIFNDKQISFQASIGNLSWIPEGADLTRAEKEKYEELAPILNL